MTYIGSNSRLNAVKGVAEIIPLTIGLETEYSNKIFKANLIFKKESTGLLYITDGVTQLSALPSVTDEVANYLNQHIADNTIHITPELTEQLNDAIVNVNRLSRLVDDISTTVESHVNNADLHVSAATIASTYATKDELFATSEQLTKHTRDESIHVSASTIASTYATKEELNEYATSDDLDMLSTSITSTYATKDEVTNQLNTYATKTELNTVDTAMVYHTTDNEIHLTSEDRVLLQSIDNNTQLQSYEVDEIITSLYS